MFKQHLKHTWRKCLDLQKGLNVLIIPKQQELVQMLKNGWKERELNTSVRTWTSCPRSHKVLDVLVGICSPSAPTERKQAESGESLNTYGPASLAHRAADDKRVCLKDGRKGDRGSVPMMCLFFYHKWVMAQVCLHKHSQKKPPKNKKTKQTNKKNHRP